MVPAMDPSGIGEGLTLIELAAPEAREMREYLGLGSNPTFTMADIGARVVIVEIFSMYCPYCQREAPRVNRFHELLRKPGTPGADVRLMGIGAGNTPFEVDFFRTAYGISFPLFPDGDFAIHKAIGEVKTPYFICLARSKGGAFQVIFSRPGGIGDPKAFLEMILEQTENRR
ncbi:MAG: TlpA family protein disulfide reductase [Desulfobacteraceae bacterium]|nr:TlpA family protein disulfide reductase [Desulfobacteraceae bacterium]